MKAWIISDLHVEFGQPFPVAPPRDADVVICAGDLLTKGIVPSIEWLGANIAPSIPVIFVAGNHEYYQSSIQESIKAARALGDRHSHVHFLENDAVDLDDVRFVGGTLWTDFHLLGGDPALVMAAAEAGMNDYRKIKFSKQPYRRFKPIHAYRMHRHTREFLGTELTKSTGRKTVVVTHHAPSFQAIPTEFHGDLLSASYASNLEELIEEKAPRLWVHGHVHRRADYVVGQTRVVSNPRGYPGEHTGFDPSLVVEV